MEYTVREIKENEICLLANFLYEAIFIPEGFSGEIPRDIIYKDKNVFSFIKDFGKSPDDYALVALVNGEIVGAVWVRTNQGYGHIDKKTPHFAISLEKPYRSHGIGTALMKAMLSLLKNKGYKQASLGVNKQNYALNMYKKLGFKIIGDGADETEYLMLCDLDQKN